MLVACRSKHSSYDATLTYLFDESEDNKYDCLCLQESTELVDGIGGTTWEGSVVLSKLLEHLFVNASHDKNHRSLHLVELGCGTGLCGMVTSHVLCGSKVSLTDRHCDLAQLNVQNHLSLKSMRIDNNVVNKFRRLKRRISSDDFDVKVCGRINQLDFKDKTFDIIAVDMPWESGRNGPTVESKTDESASHSPSSLTALRGAADVIVGAEITCLYKQQPLLAATIVALCESNPLAVVLLSFDGPPPDGGLNDSKYEREFNQLMRNYKFIGSVVNTASITWLNDDRAESKQSSSDPMLYAYMRDETLNFSNGLQSLSLPVHRDAGQSFKPLRNPTENEDMKSAHPSDFPPTPPPSSSADSEALRNTTTHHITAYYRPTAVHTCSRCHHQFFRTPVLNPPSACRYHSGYFVCRWHPAEVRLSVGHGDSLGYYGTGSEGYAAKFWDCCGSEDPTHPGCRYDRHIAY